MQGPCSLCTRRHQSQISDGDAEGQTQRPLPPGVPRRGAGQETPGPSPSCSPASPGQHGGAQDAWPPGTCADGAGRFAALQTRLRVGSAPPRLRASVRARVKWGHPTCTAEAIRSGVRGSQPGPQQHRERTGPEGGHRRRDPWRARHLAASGVGSLRRVLPGQSGDGKVLLEPSGEALSPACFGF